jgi:hypothetical protein
VGVFIASSEEEVMDKKVANHYLVAGSEIEGTIDTSSVSGRPSVDLRINGQSLQDPEFGNTEQGIEVSGLIALVTDTHSVHLRLLVPAINVGTEPVPFAGLAVLTTARSSIGGPALVDGPRQFYEIRPVGGTAEAVEF